MGFGVTRPGHAVELCQHDMSTLTSRSPEHRPLQVWGSLSSGKAPRVRSVGLSPNCSPLPTCQLHRGSPSLRRREAGRPQRPERNRLGSGCRPLLTCEPRYVGPRTPKPPQIPGQFRNWWWRSLAWVILCPTLGMSTATGSLVGANTRTRLHTVCKHTASHLVHTQTSDLVHTYTLRTSFTSLPLRRLSVIFPTTPCPDLVHWPPSKSLCTFSAGLCLPPQKGRPGSLLPSL